MIIKSDTTYKICKYLQRIGLPAILAAIITIGKVAGWDTENVALVGSAITAIFGVYLQMEYIAWETAQGIEIPANNEDKEQSNG